MALCMTLSVQLSIFLVALRVAEGARLGIRSLTANITAMNANSSRALARDEPGPPLEGCQVNYWDTICCCFIDAGILKQDRCECVSDADKCAQKVRVSYQSFPSRVIVTTWYMNQLRWFGEAGYLKGFQPVEKEFCMAAPVRLPQVDFRERAFECTCSTSMGAIEEMKCGSGCSVEDCKRTTSKSDAYWSPFLSGRGTCCLSSFTSSTEGCQQDVQPISEDVAKEILSDAVKHAALGKKQALLLSPERDSVYAMTASFETAKEKKLSTSRSGAKFFFSGDYGYILKSINRPEYDVLTKIAQPQEEFPFTIPLHEHLDFYSKRASSIGEIKHCMSFYIIPETEHVPPNSAGHLATLLVHFKGKWHWNGLLTEQYGAHTFQHEHTLFKAVWCEPASSYRIFPNRNDPITGCERIEDDFLYKRLLTLQMNYQRPESYVLEVYSDFVKAIEAATAAPYQASANTVYENKVGHMKCKCTERWWPGSLINDFLLAFEYRSSTWMVIRNSVTAIRQELVENEFRIFYKGEDTFDVKPFPIHSDQREVLFGMHFSKAWMNSWKHWSSVRTNLKRDVDFMNTVLDNPMVDYSLLVSAFYVNDERTVLDHVTLPNCVEQRLAKISTAGSVHGESDYGLGAQGSILVCFSIIDMLMEFTFSKTPENLILFSKWSDWGGKIMTMFDCLGHPQKGGCGSYHGLQPNFRGVDIPSIDSAAIQDVTDMMSADEELHTYDPVKKVKSVYKCCCNSGLGRCELVQTSGASKPLSILGVKLGSDADGCGSLKGSGWHSYWREAGRCRISRRKAEEIRLGDVAHHRILRI